MSKSEDAQNALSHVLEMLVRDGGNPQSAIDRVAIEYDLKPSVVEAWLLRRFPSSNLLDDWLKQEREARIRRGTWEAEREGVESAALKWAQDVWKNCEPDGQPNWDYCCQRFLNAHLIQKTDLRRKSWEIFRETGKRYEIARQRYLESQQGN